MKIDTSRANSKHIAGGKLDVKAAASGSESKAAKIRQRHKRTNWFKPETWIVIAEAAKVCRFQTGDMVKYLQAQAGGHEIYRSLAAGTITHWIDRTGRNPKWTDSHRKGQNMWKKGTVEESRATSSAGEFPRCFIHLNDYQFQILFRQTAVQLSTELKKT